MQVMHRPVHNPDPMPRTLDLIVFGATGFTGRLVAEHLYARCGAGGEVAWAMAGRSLVKMLEVCSRISADDALPLIEADASDAASLSALVSQARCHRHDGGALPATRPGPGDGLCAPGHGLSRPLRLIPAEAIGDTWTVACAAG